jgi:hypothetical protein
VDRFLIAPINTGLQTNLRPWLIPDDAFETLNNAYVFRGRVRKRFGGRLMGVGFDPSLPVTAPLFSRLRINLGNTDGSGDASGTVPGDVFTIGQMFSIGDEIFTVQALGTPVDMLDTGASSTATYDTTDGDYVFAGAAATTAIWFYPGLPVMGLTIYDSGAINNQPTYGFDTQFAYIFTGGFWQQSGDPFTDTPIWHGTDINFFWTSNWRGITPGVMVLFVSNFYVVNYNGLANANDDPIWWLNGSTWTAASGATGFYFMPQKNTTTPPTPLAPQTGQYVVTARLVIPFKNRLLLLNTVENNGANTGGTINTNTNYVNRLRYSFNGSPFAQNAWYEPGTKDNSGLKTGIGAGAGFIDATTEEAIISAEFIKDRLIVYFERSTWEIAYTGNAVLPFVWQKINTELGSEAQQSTVPFDRDILTIGNTGVHACNGANVQRIDTKIPDEVFEIFNKNIGVQRVAGIRDYFVEMVYWSFPSVDENPNNVYPNRVLVYNYRNNSWAINDDCITAFGYFEQQNGTTWASSLDTWEDANFPWDSGAQQAQFRQVIAGNQQGYVFIVDAQASRNAPVMQISNMSYNATTQALTLIIVNHTLNTDTDLTDENSDFIYIENEQGSTFSGIGIFPVTSVIDANTITVGPVQDYTGVYTGGATATRVSNIRIATKQFNPYIDKGRDVYLAKIDFGVLRTTDGQITVDYYPSASSYSMIQNSTATGAIQGTGVLETFPYDPILYPFEQEQTRLWHQIYFQSEGECIQLFMYMTFDQITEPDVAFSPFELEGMCLHTMPVGDRVQ